MATTTNFGWETPDDTDLVKDGAAAIRTALGGVDTSFVDLKGGTTGQVLSKASNTDLDFSWVAQDDSNAIQNAIVDAKGDLISATAADTPARLAVGTNGQILTADSSTATGLKWASPTSSGFSGVYCTGSSGQTVNATTQTILTWDTEVYDTDGYHSTSTNTGRITIPTGKAGYYLVHLNMNYAANANVSHRTLYLVKNGTIFLHGGNSSTPNSNVATNTFYSMIVNLAEGDYITAEAYLGATMNVGKDLTYPASYFQAQYLGA